MTLSNDQAGLLILLSSPSGAGKSTLARRLMEDNDRMQFSVSATTRPPRPGEKDGREYYFKSRAEFETMVAQGELLEHAEVFGNFYGTPREPVEAALAQGRDVVFDVDWQGGQQIRSSSMGGSLVSIFILPPSIAALEQRLNKRGQDSAEVVAGRMARARDEISHWPEYDFVLVNDDLETCYNALNTILDAERLRRERQRGLVPFVNALNEEFEARK